MNGDLGVLLFAALVFVVLIFLMRWVFRPSRPPRVTVPGDAVPSMLVTIARGLSRRDGLSLRAVLGDAEIRSSMSTRRDGLVDVAVFGADEPKARSLLPPGALG